jgi:hypothetical protein
VRPASSEAATLATFPSDLTGHEVRDVLVPLGGGRSHHRPVRDEIERRVRGLLRELGVALMVEMRALAAHRVAIGERMTGGPRPFGWFGRG